MNEKVVYLINHKQGSIQFPTEEEARKYMVAFSEQFGIDISDAKIFKLTIVELKNE